MTNADIYAKITDAILARLAAGVIPWKKPWTGGGLPKNFLSKKPYRGVNIWLLAGSGYTSPFWGTFKQISEAGGKVKKGEKSTMIVFWNVTTKTQPDGTEKKGFSSGIITFSTFASVREWTPLFPPGMPWKRSPILTRRKRS